MLAVASKFLGILSIVASYVKTKCQALVTISQAQVYSLPRSCVLLKLTADQVLVFDWIAGSCQVKLLKTELGCSEAC